MTVKWRARMGATLRHIRCVWGKPCSSRIGGPEPDRRTKMVVSPVWTSAVSKSSSIPEVHTGYDSGNERDVGPRGRRATTSRIGTAGAAGADSGGLVDWAARDRSYRRADARSLKAHGCDVRSGPPQWLGSPSHRRAKAQGP